MKLKKTHLYSLLLLVMLLMMPSQTTNAAVKLSTPVLKSAKSAGYNKITVSWGRVEGAQGYRLYRKTAGGTWQNVKTLSGVNSTVHTDDRKVQTGQKYYYTVRAYIKKDGVITWSSFDKTGLTATASMNRASMISTHLNASCHPVLNWKEVDGAQGYRVYRRMPKETWKILKTLGPSVQSYTDTSAVAGKKYQYMVRAYRRESGVLQFSPVDNTGAKTDLTLSTPSLKTAVYSESSDKVSVSWNPVKKATGYCVYRKVPGGIYLRIANVDANTTSYQDKNDADAPYYTYTVKAYMASPGAVSWSGCVNKGSLAILPALKDPSALDRYGLTLIEGTSQLTVSQMRAYIKSVNPNVPDSVLKMIPYYISEGKAEGIRGDLAFCQSCLETGNFTFKGSAVTLDQNNFCGLGVTSNGMKGNSFATPQLGIRAQIQHLKAYANKEPLRQTQIDPRFHYVTRGCSPYLQWLGIQENPLGYGWAAGADYSDHILRIYNSIRNM